MKVSDILAHLRIRLSDTPDEFAKFSDEFLINLIELHQNRILSDFEYNIQSFTKELNAQDEVVLDFELSKLITAFLNGNPLRIVSYAFYLKNAPLNSLVFFEKSPKIYGFSSKISGELELFGVKKAFLSEKDDELILDDDFINLIVLSVLVDSLRMLSAPDNSQRVAFFNQLLAQERQQMIALISKKRASSSFQAPFIKV